MTQASQSRLPLLIWGEATAYSTYIQNKIPANKTKLSPFETWTGHKPDFSYLRILGSKAFVHIPDAKWKKLEQKCIEGILVVFFEFIKAYHIYLPTLRRVVTSREIITDETKGYIGVVPNPHTEPVLESQFDPFVELVKILLYLKTIKTNNVKLKLFLQGGRN